MRASTNTGTETRNETGAYLRGNRFSSGSTNIAELDTSVVLTEEDNSSVAGDLFKKNGTLSFETRTQYFEPVFYQNDSYTDWPTPNTSRGSVVTTPSFNY